MNYEKIGEDLYSPKSDRSPLKSINDIKFSYRFNSEIKGEFIITEITSKLFHHHETFVKKSTYRLKLGEIEDCVKSHIKNHMLQLGIKKEMIPKNLINFNISEQGRDFKSSA